MTTLPGPWPPKRAARLVRFDHAARQLAAGHRAAQVAMEGGYTDQAHLHRDIVAFTGATPTTVAAAPWRVLVAVDRDHVAAGTSDP